MSLPQRLQQDNRDNNTSPEAREAARRAARAARASPPPAAPPAQAPARPASFSRLGAAVVCVLLITAMIWTGSLITRWLQANAPFLTPPVVVSPASRPAEGR